MSATPVTRGTAFENCGASVAFPWIWFQRFGIATWDWPKNVYPPVSVAMASLRLPWTVDPAAATPTIRVWAVASPITVRDTLRLRGYTWYPGDHRRPKAWYRDLPPAAVDAECAWLREHIYAGRPGHIAFDHFDARDRYSNRM